MSVLPTSALTPKSVIFPSFFSLLIASRALMGAKRWKSVKSWFPSEAEDCLHMRKGSSVGKA